MVNIRLYNEQAEVNILGSVFFDNEILEDCGLEADDFYLPQHKEIYEAMLEIKAKGLMVDPIITADTLKSRGSYIKFEELSLLMNAISIPENYDYHAKIIKERAAQRRLMRIADNLKMTTGKTDISETIQQAVKDIQALEIADEEALNYVPDMIESAVERIEKNNKKGDLTGIPTGFTELNKLTGGWQSGRYYILGARPKMGKTSCFCQMADIAAEKAPVIIFSLEMSKDELMKLLIYQNSKIDSMLEQTGKLTPKEFKEMREAVKPLHDKDIFIDDKSRTISDFRMTLKKAQKFLNKKGKEQIGLIVVDYVQMIHGDKKLQRNYQLEEISRGLKEIAKDFNLCVLALSQLNREVETRRDKRPIPSDLRDSGSFEQDCDGLMLMYRDAYYNGYKDKNHVVYKYFNADVKADIVDINFFLNRHGAAGIFKLDFVTPYRRFFNHGEQENIIIPASSSFQDVERPDDCPF